MDPNDPSHHNDWRQDFGRDDNATWGWVAAAVFVAVVLFIAFTSGHDATQQTAANDVSQPPASSRTMMPTCATRADWQPGWHAVDTAREQSVK
jgi:hypothetical protein